MTLHPSSRPGWCRRTDEGWLLEVYVQPGAKNSALAGEHDGALKIRIASPPLEGRANAALQQFIARQTGVPKSAVRIVSGASSRRKRVLIAAAGADVDSLLPGDAA